MINTRVYEAETLKKLQKIEIDKFKDFADFCDRHEINYFAIAGSAIGAVRHRGMIPWDDDIDIGMLREDYEKFLKLVPQFLGDQYNVNGPDCVNQYYNLVPNISKKGTKFIVDLAEGRYNIGIFMDIFVFENISEDSKEIEKQIKKTQIWRNLYILSNIDYFKFMKNEKLGMKMRYFVCGIIHHILKHIKKSKQWIYKMYLKEALLYNGKTNNYTILGDPFARKCCIKRNEIFPIRKVPFEDTMINIPNKCEDMLTRRFGDFMKLPPVEKRVNHCPVELDLGEN